MIGANFPGDFKIKKSKLRGVESCGMNISLLAGWVLAAMTRARMVLPEDAPVGMRLRITWACLTLFLIVRLPPTVLTASL